MTQPYRYDSAETGAPSVNNVAGSYTAMLLAVAVNGYNVRAITSITVSSGVATVLCPTHGQACGVGQFVKITGSPVSALNGNKQPTLVDSNNFTYPAPGVADGTYTATDARRAPLGWAVEYADGSNLKIILRRTAAEANAQMLRVNDTNTSPATATSARALVVSGATDVDTFTARAPTETQLSGGMHCNKGTSSATAKRWVVVGNDRAIWVFVGEAGGTNYLLSLAFFDLNSYRAGDASGTVISGTGTSASTATSNSALLVGASSFTTTPSAFNTVGMALSSGAGDPVPMSVIGAASSVGFGWSVSGSTTDANDFVMHRPIYVIDTGVGIRGDVPGLEQLLAQFSVFAGPHSVITSADGAYHLGVRTNNFSNTGAAVFSLADDWY